MLGKWGKERRKLHQHLLDDSTLLYGVLDAATVPDLPTRLFEAGLPFNCLIAGDLESDLMHVAPYVVHLLEGNEFTEWVLEEGFGDDWGIFVHSRLSLIEMRRHFRSLLNVYDEAGNALTFRFYDPRVLRQYLPTCRPADLNAFFNKVDVFFAEAEGGENLLRYEVNNDELMQTVLN